MLNCRLKVISPYNHGSSKCKRQIRMISEIMMKHLWDKGQMWPLFATTAAYAMNTFASEALSGLSPFQLVFLRDPPDLTSLSFPKIERSRNLDRSFRNIYIIPSFPTREQHAHSVQNARSRFTKLNQSYSC